MTDRETELSSGQILTPLNKSFQASTAEGELTKKPFTDKINELLINCQNSYLGTNKYVSNHSESSYCYKCLVNFDSNTVRKHHCRACNKRACGKCSTLEYLPIHNGHLQKYISSMSTETLQLSDLPLTTFCLPDIKYRLCLHCINIFDTANDIFQLCEDKKVSMLGQACSGTELHTIVNQLVNSNRVKYQPNSLIKAASISSYSSINSVTIKVDVGTSPINFDQISNINKKSSIKDSKSNRNPLKDLTNTPLRCQNMQTETIRKVLTNSKYLNNYTNSNNKVSKKQTNDGIDKENLNHSCNNKTPLPLKNTISDTNDSSKSLQDFSKRLVYEQKSPVMLDEPSCQVTNVCTGTTTVNVASLSINDSLQTKSNTCEYKPPHSTVINVPSLDIHENSVPVLEFKKRSVNIVTKVQSFLFMGIGILICFVIFYVYFYLICKKVKQTNTTEINNNFEMATSNKNSFGQQSIHQEFISDPIQLYNNNDGPTDMSISANGIISMSSTQIRNGYRILTTTTAIPISPTSVKENTISLLFYILRNFLKVIQFLNIMIHQNNDY